MLRIDQIHRLDESLELIGVVHGLSILINSVKWCYPWVVNQSFSGIILRVQKCVEDWRGFAVAGLGRVGRLDKRGETMAKSEGHSDPATCLAAYSRRLLAKLRVC